MPSPFPGMDPYLEHPARWQSVHPQLVASLPALIEPTLPERYVVSVEERVYLLSEGGPLRQRQPDAIIIDQKPFPPGGRGGTAVLPRMAEVTLPEEEPVRESFLEVRDLERDEAVVTVIEVLSPTNKRPGAHRDEYLMKRGAVLSSRTSLVEIDLLRAGPRLPAAGAPPDYDYAILVARGYTRPHGDLIWFGLREPIPAFPLPLRAGDDEPWIDLSPALANIYQTNRLARRINYALPSEPPLSEHDEAWAEALLREKGLR